MSNHTKGPWKGYRSIWHSEECAFVIKNEIGNTIIAHVIRELGINESEALANAILIASAPQLYEELQEANKQIVNLLDRITKVGLELEEAKKQLESEVQNKWMSIANISQSKLGFTMLFRSKEKTSYMCGVLSWVDAEGYIVETEDRWAPVSEFEEFMPLMPKNVGHKPKNNE